MDYLELKQKVNTLRCELETLEQQLTIKEEEDLYLGFLRGEVAVNCMLKQEAEIFLAYLAGRGMKWFSGHSLLGSSLWDMYSHKTCYTHKDNTITYADTLFCQPTKRIVEFEEMKRWLA